MSTRLIMNTPVVETLQDEDSQIFEQENFVSATVQVLKEKLHQDPIYCENPQIYSEGNKGGTILTRENVFLTVKYLLLASYGAYKGSTDYFVYLGVFDSSTGFIKYGLGRISEVVEVDTLQFTYDDETTEEFEDTDSTPFSGFVVSPYGEIPGTETWTVV